jgi:hypothetical protein
MDEKREHETEDRRGEHNELGYRNADEDAEYDECGSRGPGPEGAAGESRDERPSD